MALVVRKAQEYFLSVDHHGFRSNDVVCDVDGCEHTLDLEDLFEFEPHVKRAGGLAFEVEAVKVQVAVSCDEIQVARG